MSAPLSIRGLAWGYGEAVLGRALELELAAGELVAVVGPNGAGKTTLLRALCGRMAPLAGTVQLSGADLAQLSVVQRARLVAILPQTIPLDGELTVRELVELGRTAHLGLWGRLRPVDREAVEHALVACDLLELSSRQVGRISGGEQQRATLAMCLAQRAPLLLLDEPTTHLDLRRRHELFELLGRLRREQAIAVVCVLHDLAEAYREADRVLVLSAGLARQVDADDAGRAAKLAAAFDVPVDRIHL